MDPGKFTAFNVLEDGDLRQGMLTLPFSLFPAFLAVLLCSSGYDVDGVESGIHGSKTKGKENLFRGMVGG